MFGLLQGDFGYSFEHSLPVSDIIGDRILLTFVVSFSTIVFTWVVSFIIGTYSAVYQYSFGDYALSFLGFVGLATPNFLLALVLLWLANVYFGTSIGGLMDPEYLEQPWSGGKILSVLEHLWVPVIVIGTSRHCPPEKQDTPSVVPAHMRPCASHSTMRTSLESPSFSV